jgi:uncharacterized protein YoaH (UPF0181 family)
MFVDTNNTGSTLVNQNSVEIYNQESSKYKTKSTDNEESNSFQTVLDEVENKNFNKDTRTDKEIIEDMKKLVEDIKSVMKTGMTKGELEALEELLAKIKEEMKKENYNKKDIEKMMDKLEKDIALYKKKIAGEVIIEADSLDKKNNSKNSADSTGSIGDITSRLDMAEEGITELKKGVKEDIPKQVQSQSELLTMIKKFQNE